MVRKKALLPEVTGYPAVDRNFDNVYAWINAADFDSGVTWEDLKDNFLDTDTIDFTFDIVAKTIKADVTADYDDISANDAATDVTGAELETLTDTSNADSLHTHSLVNLDDVSLADPDDDRIVFWDDSDSQFEFLDLGAGLGITGNTISVLGMSGLTDGYIPNYDSATGGLENSPLYTDGTDLTIPDASKIESATGSVNVTFGATTLDLNAPGNITLDSAADITLDAATINSLGNIIMSEDKIIGIATDQERVVFDGTAGEIGIRGCDVVVDDGAAIKNASVTEFVAFGDTASELGLSANSQIHSLVKHGIGDMVAVDRMLHAEENDAETAATTWIGRFSHTSTGVVENDFGAGIEFELESASYATDIVAGRVSAAWVDEGAAFAKVIIDVSKSDSPLYSSFSFVSDTTPYIEMPDGAFIQNETGNANVYFKTDEIEINATDIDINGSVDISGTLDIGSVAHDDGTYTGILTIDSSRVKYRTAAEIISDGSGVPTTTQVIAGTGLAGGGALSSDVTLNVGAGAGITVAADTVSVTGMSGLTDDYIPYYDSASGGFLDSPLSTDGTDTTSSGHIIMGEDKVIGIGAGLERVVFDGDSGEIGIRGCDVVVDDGAAIKNASVTEFVAFGDTSNELGLGANTQIHSFVKHGIGDMIAVDRMLHAEENDAVTAATTWVQRLTHTSTGVVGNSFGSGIEFELESASYSTNIVAGRISTVWFDEESAVSKMVFDVSNADTPAYNTFEFVADTTPYIQVPDGAFVQNETGNANVYFKTDEVEVNATAVDINGAVDISSTLDIGSVAHDDGTYTGILTIDGSRVKYRTAAEVVSDGGATTATTQVIAGTGLTGGGALSSDVTLDVGEGTGITVAADAISTNDSEIVHDDLSGFVPNEHINHTGVTLTAGNGLSGGGDISASRSFALDLNELGTETTIASGDFIAMVDITDNGSQKITFANFEGLLNHDNLSGVVSDEHVAHSGVTLTAGNGLTGGGTIASNRTFAVGAGDGITVAADTVSVTGFSGLTDGYIPNYDSGTGGFENSPLYTDGTRVGIGTTSFAMLDSATTSTVAVATASSTYMSIRGGTNSEAMYSAENDARQYRWGINGDDQWGLWDDTDDRYRILFDTSGNVGFQNSSTNFNMLLCPFSSPGTIDTSFGFFVSRTAATDDYSTGMKYYAANTGARKCGIYEENQNVWTLYSDHQTNPDIHIANNLVINEDKWVGIGSSSERIVFDGSENAIGLRGCAVIIDENQSILNSTGTAAVTLESGTVYLEGAYTDIAGDLVFTGNGDIGDDTDYPTDIWIGGDFRTGGTETTMITDAGGTPVSAMSWSNTQNVSMINLGVGDVGMTTDRMLHVEDEDAGTNNTVWLSRLTHTTTNTAVDDFGVGMEYELESPLYATNIVAGRTSVKWHDESQGEAKFLIELAVDNTGYNTFAFVADDVPYVQVPDGAFIDNASSNADIAWKSSEIEINATTVDINGNADVSGTLGVGTTSFAMLDSATTSTVAVATASNTYMSVRGGTNAEAMYSAENDARQYRWGINGADQFCVWDDTDNRYLALFDTTGNVGLRNSSTDFNFLICPFATSGTLNTDRGFFVSHTAGNTDYAVGMKYYADNTGSQKSGIYEENQNVWTLYSDHQTNPDIHIRNNLAIGDGNKIGNETDNASISFNTNEVEVNATTVDINGNTDMSGAIILGGAVSWSTGAASYALASADSVAGIAYVKLNAGDFGGEEYFKTSNQTTGQILIIHNISSGYDADIDDGEIIVPSETTVIARYDGSRWY